MRFALGLAASLMMAAPALAQDAGTTASTEIDPQAYAGIWYEIARTPAPFQEMCAGGVTATYELVGAGTVKVTNRCDGEDGQPQGITGEAEVVLGSRFLDDRTQVSKLKRLVLRTAAFVSKFTSGMDLSDAHNGLRAIDRGTLGKIHLKQNRMAHASEIVNQFAQIQPRWVEHPVEIIYTEYSKGKGQSLLNGVNILTELFVK